MSRTVMIKTKPRKGFKVGDVIEISAILEHPMESGMRKDKDGKLIPAEYISNITVKYGDEIINSMTLSGTVSANPFIGFNLSVSKPEANLVIEAVDNKGVKQENSLLIKAE